MGPGRGPVRATLAGPCRRTPRVADGRRRASARPGRAAARHDRGRQPPTSRAAGRARRCRPASATAGAEAPGTRTRSAGRCPATGSPPIRDRARRGRVETGRDPQERRLAAAARAEDRDDLARLDRERDVAQDDVVGQPGRSFGCPRERPAKTERSPTSCLVSDPAVRRGGVPRRSAGGGSMDTRARSWSVLVAWAVPIRGGVGGWPWVPGTQKSRSPLSDCGPGTGERSPSARR